MNFIPITSQVYSPLELCWAFFAHSCICTKTIMLKISTPTARMIDRVPRIVLVIAIPLPLALPFLIFARATMARTRPTRPSRPPTMKIAVNSPRMVSTRAVIASAGLASAGSPAWAAVPAHLAEAKLKQLLASHRAPSQGQSCQTYSLLLCRLIASQSCEATHHYTETPIYSSGFLR